MLEALKAWLNGTRDYYNGVAIYSQIGTNEDLLEVLKKGPNDFRIKRLQEELLEICNHLKAEKNEEIASTGDSLTLNGKSKTNKSVTQNNDRGICSKRWPCKSDGCAGNCVAASNPINQELYSLCKLDADHQYKKVMNDRGILFKLTECEKWEDPNLPHKLNERVALALAVISGHQLTSELYDKADYVKLHGHLSNNNIEENEYDHLEDHLVNLRLTNARKAYNKLKAKEATPERVMLMQQHEINIKKLETKWLSLKPQS